MSRRLHGRIRKRQAPSSIRAKIAYFGKTGLKLTDQPEPLRQTCRRHTLNLDRPTRATQRDGERKELVTDMCAVPTIEEITEGGVGAKAYSKSRLLTSWPTFALQVIELNRGFRYIDYHNRSYLDHRRLRRPKEATGVFLLILYRPA